ncbi:MAG: hypothetical protein AMXMBFR16_11690 [Candidatus Uhrbacteria bacterium]
MGGGVGGDGGVGEDFGWDVLDGGVAGGDGVDLALVDVDAGHADAGAGEGDGQRQPDGAETDDGDARLAVGDLA